MGKMLTRLHFLLGAEIGKKKEYASNLFTSFKKKYGNDIEVFNFYPYDLDIDHLISELSNQSLFSSARVFHLYNWDDFKVKDVNQLIKIFSSLTENLLILIYSDKNKISEKISKLVPSENKKIFYELNDAEKKKYLIDYFSSKKISITFDAIMLLLDLVDNKSDNLKKSCQILLDKIIEKNITEITKELVEELIEHNKDENVFTLFHKICQRDFPRSLEIMQSLLFSGEVEGIGLIAGLWWQIKKLYGLCEVLSNGYISDKDLLLFDIRGKQNQNSYRRALQNFSISEIAFMVVLLKDFEIELKHNKKEMQLTILTYLLYLMILGKPRALDDKKALMEESFAHEWI